MHIHVVQSHWGLKPQNGPGPFLTAQVATSLLKAELHLRICQNTERTKRHKYLMDISLQQSYIAESSLISGKNVVTY